MHRIDASPTLTISALPYSTLVGQQGEIQMNRKNISIAALTAVLAAAPGYAGILSTTAAVRSDNSLLVDLQVTTGGKAGQIVVTYQTSGVDPLVSRPTQVSTTDPTTLTIGRLRAN